jgi:outer membrane lipoprotein SlyB
MLGCCAVIIAAIGGCAPDYSPDTYNSAALQQANKVDTGIVIGYREVRISVDGTIGAVTGGAAGGILGAEADSPAVPTALAALGGTVVGGVVGTAVEHVTSDTTGWEYIVREPKGDLISVTQREVNPLPIGQKVLVIEGKQARIVPDYASTAYDAPPAATSDQSKAITKASAPADQGKAVPNAATPGASAPAATPSDTAASAAAASAAPSAAPPDAPPSPSAGSGDKPAPSPP